MRIGPLGASVIAAGCALLLLGTPAGAQTEGDFQPANMNFIVMWDAGATAGFAVVNSSGSLVDRSSSETFVTRTATGEYCITDPTLAGSSAIVSAQQPTSPRPYSVGVRPGGCAEGGGVQVSWRVAANTSLTRVNRQFSLLWLSSNDVIHSLAVRADGAVRFSDVAGVSVTRRNSLYCIRAANASPIAVGSLQQTGSDGQASIFVTTTLSTECDAAGEYDFAVEIGGW